MRKVGHEKRKRRKGEGRGKRKTKIHTVKKRHIIKELMRIKR